jgi:alpha-tubulin suppressor-like RCC1 family protein
LKNDGTVVAWGFNYYGQVTGTPTTEAPYAIASPVTLGGQILSGVTAIAAGGNHTVALKNDGTVVAWGYNRYGQVTGTPTIDSATASPVTLGGQILSGVTAIAAGGGHTVALKNDGTVVAWGGNNSGQVTGTPTIADPSSAIASPVTLGGQVLSGVTAIAAGGRHTVALKNDGAVVAWGSDYYGETTVPVAAQGGVTAVAAGGSHTVALKNDGTVVAWGYNFYGAVTGIPTTDDAIASPVTLEGQVLSGVTAIAAGGGTVALIGGVPLLPSLKVRPNGNELILSWPTNAPGFTLQSTPDLTPPVTWLDSTNVPAVIGAHFTLTNTTTGDARFYRLRKM